MSLSTIFFPSLIACFAVLAAACSDEPGTPDKTSQGAEAGCLHLNEVCAGVQGFPQQDCSSSDAAYEKLSPSQKAQVDAVMPCVLAAKTCDPAIQCLRPAPQDASGTGEIAGGEQAEEACEHINDVCADEQQFQEQDCSTSSGDYEGLSANDKSIADDVGRCILGAQSCQAAFQCLQFD